MTTYDFDTPIDRRNTQCEKWDIRNGELPLWVADMDFRTAPEIIDALKARLDHGVFGYAQVPESWRAAYCNWWRVRHDANFQPDHLLFCTGVIPAITSVVQRLTCPGDHVVVQTPVYNIFFNSVVNSGRIISENCLIERNGAYRMDFEDLKRRFANPRTRLMILCNPHNPTGSVWTREDLARVGELAQAHGVVVLSDEIHCDLTDPGVNYTPFASASDVCAANSVTCVAPTKAFNLAGIQTAAVVVPDVHLRAQVHRALNNAEVAEPNVFACPAAEAAFREGGAWLDALRSYLANNKQVVRDYLAREIPCVRVVSGPATYLMWLDCRDVCKDSADFTSYLRERTGLWLNAGSAYGKVGEGFLRMNVACPRATVHDALDRFRDGVRTYLS